MPGRASADVPLDSLENKFIVICRSLKVPNSRGGDNTMRGSTSEAWEALNKTLSDGVNWKPDGNSNRWLPIVYTRPWKFPIFGCRSLNIAEGFSDQRSRSFVGQARKHIKMLRIRPKRAVTV